MIQWCFWGYFFCIVTPAAITFSVFAGHTATLSLLAYFLKLSSLLRNHAQSWISSVSCSVFLFPFQNVTCLFLFLYILYRKFFSTVCMYFRHHFMVTALFIRILQHLLFRKILLFLPECFTWTKSRAFCSALFSRVLQLQEACFIGCSYSHLIFGFAQAYQSSSTTLI